MNKDSYTLLSNISRGAYGKVDRVLENDSQAIYALKTLSKSQVLNYFSLDKICDYGQLPFLIYLFV